MSRLWIVYFLLGWLSLWSCHTNRKYEKISFHQQKVLFLGNSISQNGTYVSCLEYILSTLHPDIELDFISVGLSSETVSCLSENEHPFLRPCLQERLDRALEIVRPDIVVACYGMNDGIYHPWNPTIQSAFEKGIQELQQKVKKIEAKLVLVTPPPFDTMPIQNKTVDLNAQDFGYGTPFQNYDRTLAKFGTWITNQSDPNTYVVDWHGEINRWIQEKRKTAPEYSISRDGIHPGGEGHWLMAKLFLNELGWLEDLDVPPNWDKVMDDPRFRQIDEIRTLKALSYRNFIGYTRGETVKSILSKPIMILMGGQSNMVGSRDRDRIKNEKVPGHFKYYNYGLNAQLKKDTARFGPESGLIDVLTETYPHQPFILIKYTIGGSSLLDWAPNYSIDKATVTGNIHFGHMFESFILKVDSLASLFDAEIGALLWMQGEPDARIPEAGKDYQVNFTTFIDSIRSRIKDPELPVIFGLVNPPEDGYPAVHIVRKAQRAIANQKNNYLVETDHLSKKTDQVHLDSDGQWELGRLFGQEMINVIADF